jgi:hypothetical protein
MPGNFESAMNNIGGVANMAYPWLDYLDPKKKPQIDPNAPTGGTPSDYGW